MSAALSTKLRIIRNLCLRLFMFFDLIPGEIRGERCKCLDPYFLNCPTGVIFFIDDMFRAN